ncbi:hypothetical protein EDC19_2817 [Natranaerovirga hydrolytica]|uniref:CAAX prenyl protease 2/Lysostaphin resistance protein A-like domain-containing protein n=1 Tax=Natranaerovirga hydrolytica TaxID=680378 RepID=A0A4R1MAH3_9FIRM|nr:type II CAAX endopeptidase family protein [Natranaerovirga hydrolytica]TCK86763.1 hypothetical protein EDC19_2817 [Natranaerovirga hydrolytica]
MGAIKKVNRLFLVIICLNVIVSFLYMDILYLLNLESTILVQILFPQLVLLLLPTVIYLFLNKTQLKEILRINPINLLDCFLIILFSLFIFPVGSFLNVLSQLFVANHIEGVLLDITSLPFVLSLTIIAIVPSITEELLCRGVLYQSYRKVSIVKAGLLSSFLFGVIHMNLNQFLYAFVLGFIFILLVEATNSIFSSIIAHFTINTIPITALYLLSQYDTMQMSMPTETVDADIIISLIGIFVLMLFTLPIAVFIFYIIAKRNNTLEHIKSIFNTNKNKSSADPTMLIPKKENLLTWHIYICIFLFIGFSLLIELL